MVAGGEFFEDSEARLEVVDGEALSFVEDDDGVCDVVKFSRTRGFCSKQGFIELNGCSDDDGCVPVFGGETGGCGLIFFMLGS